MKKSAVIIAIALGFTMTSVHANNDIVKPSNTDTVLVVTGAVNPFCMSIVKEILRPLVN